MILGRRTPTHCRSTTQPLNPNPNPNPDVGRVHASTETEVAALLWLTPLGRVGCGMAAPAYATQLRWYQWCQWCHGWMLPVNVDEHDTDVKGGKQSFLAVGFDQTSFG